MHAPRFSSTRSKLAESLLSGMSAVRIHASKLSNGRVLMEVELQSSFGMTAADDEQQAFRYAMDLLSALEDNAAQDKAAQPDEGNAMDWGEDEEGAAP